MRHTAIALLVLFLTWTVMAAPITLREARLAVQQWQADSHHTMGLDLKQKIEADSWSYADPQVGNVFHYIGYQSGGYTITATDDRITPVIAFSSSGSLQPDLANPLWALLTHDAPRRLLAVQQYDSPTAGHTLHNNLRTPSATATFS